MITYIDLKTRLILRVLVGTGFCHLVLPSHPPATKQRQTAQAQRVYYAIHTGSHSMFFLFSSSSVLENTRFSFILLCLVILTLNLISVLLLFRSSSPTFLELEYLIAKRSTEITRNCRSMFLYRHRRGWLWFIMSCH